MQNHILILRVRTVLTTKHLVSKDIKGPTSRSGWRFQPECASRVFEGVSAFKTFRIYQKCSKKGDHTKFFPGILKGAFNFLKHIQKTVKGEKNPL